ncbi:WASH complex subunit 3 isoform X1 [Sagmatias obliquidens]|uniref:WASH complex subunit 3 n=1 Tax=Tursiops truncatus TaxID=9739 RepID=A0A2U3ZYM2_TURTR|nr:WASH complex subunit 3 isoform X1 [Tursiops truncatus]XP_026963149.1 WASH complex subunit 3 isoform X1 [Lagenorhynchus obliquidens]XP_033722085.1 WASH complex subunit 3 isoform X1 [Tursiops truncatus]
MDEDGLPLMGSGIDLTKVPAIQQKRTVAFLNQFVVHTVQFLNRFSTVCEEKLADLSLRIQQIETTLNILDAKLSSIPGLDDVTFEVSPVSVTRITNETHSETTSEQSQLNSLQDSGPQESEVTPENILTVAKDPRYARYLKMVQVGVPVMAIRNKMISEGLDPDLLERPDAPVPDGEGTSERRQCGSQPFLAHTEIASWSTHEQDPHFPSLSSGEIPRHCDADQGLPPSCLS